MRSAVLAFCVCAAACSGQTVRSPTSAASVPLSPSQTQAQSGSDLPFNGSLTALEKDVATPPTLLVDGVAEGTATHLGSYTATFTATVNLPTGTATGNYTFTAANGDQLFATFAGVGVPAGPGTASIVETAEIVGGTGRFASASGTLVIRRILDQPTGKSSGSVSGSISLNK